MGEKLTAMRSQSLVFSGDIGGTKIRLGLWTVGESGLELVRDWTAPSLDFSGPIEALGSVCADAELRGLSACFGVAGPVKRARSHLTNLPWVVDSNVLENEFGFHQVTVINDLEATAWAIPVLDSSGLSHIKEGEADPRGTLAVLAAGTGLGQAALVRMGEGSVVCSGEGGHADFAPRTPEELDIFRFLAEKYGHVSWERLLSGPGLVDLAEYFFSRSGDSIGDWFESLGNPEDRAAAVATEALKAGSPSPCSLALELFVALLGAQAGNVALGLGATGGVVLAGGIPPKILPALQEGVFTERFLDKGRMRSFLERIPVSVILDQDAPLLGAATRAVALMKRG
jgi:glucokinase